MILSFDQFINESYDFKGARITSTVNTLSRIIRNELKAGMAEDSENFRTGNPHTSESRTVSRTEVFKRSMLANR